MKHLIIAVFCIGIFHSAACQNFEGTLTWTSKSDIKLSDEQTQEMKNAKKQMEAQMKDPEFKKQMEQNPALKEMMEKQLKNMESMEGGNIGGFLPEKTVISVKGKNTRTVMGESNIIIYQGNENKTYNLDGTSKTYTEIPSSDSTTPDTEINITKTAETATINGYKCIKYLLHYDGSAEMKQSLWVTKDIKDINPSQFAGTSKGNMNWFFKDIDGFPVKIEIKTPQGNMYSELTEIKRAKIPDSDFQIPSGYKKK